MQRLYFLNQWVFYDEDHGRILPDIVLLTYFEKKKQKFDDFCLDFFTRQVLSKDLVSVIGANKARFRFGSRDPVFIRTGRFDVDTRYQDREVKGSVGIKWFFTHEEYKADVAYAADIKDVADEKNRTLWLSDRHLDKSSWYDVSGIPDVIRNNAGVRFIKSHFFDGEYKNIIRARNEETAKIRYKRKVVRFFNSLMKFFKRSRSKFKNFGLVENLNDVVFNVMAFNNLIGHVEYILVKFMKFNVLGGISSRVSELKQLGGVEMVKNFYGCLQFSFVFFY